MSDLLLAGLTFAFVAGSRILSHFEHKKTSRQITEIHFLMNGEVEKKIRAAIEEGIKIGKGE